MGRAMQGHHPSVVEGEVVNLADLDSHRGVLGQRSQKAAETLGKSRWRDTRRVQPHEHDTYKNGAKPADGTTCSDCGVTFRAGRWIWPAAGEQPGRAARCPACHRISDRYPAGVIDVEGALGARGEDLENMIKNLERTEKAEHPLERLMALERSETSLHVETTGVHLARRIASGLERQKVTVEMRFAEEQNFLRVEARI